MHSACELVPLFKRLFRMWYIEVSILKVYNAFRTRDLCHYEDRMISALNPGMVSLADGSQKNAENGNLCFHSMIEIEYVFLCSILKSPTIDQNIHRRNHSFNQGTWVLRRLQHQNLLKRVNYVLRRRLYCTHGNRHDKTLAFKFLNLFTDLLYGILW